MENAKAIIKWQYWLYYHGDIEETFRAIYPQWLADHFYAKFDGKCKRFDGNTWMALVDLFMEMSIDNQALLAEWVTNNYNGVNNILKQI